MKAVGWIEGDGVHWLGDRLPEQDTTLFVQTPEPDPAELGEPIGYRLEPIYAARRGYVTTQAFILCSSCGGAISSNGGPGYNSLCLKCLDKLDIFNKLMR